MEFFFNGGLTNLAQLTIDAVFFLKFPLYKNMLAKTSIGLKLNVNFFNKLSTFVVGKKCAAPTRLYITRVCKTFMPGYFPLTLNCAH